MNSNGWGRVAAGVVVGLALFSGVCLAQTPGAAASFGDMPRKVKAGQVVIVTDDAGRELRGKVAEVSGLSLVILARDENGRWAARTEFAPSGVREVKRTGPIWDGAIIGFGVGLIPALLIENSCTNCADAGVTMLLGGIGAGIGLGIDAAFGPKRVFRAPRAGRAEVTVAPVIGRTRQGAVLAFRF